MNNINKAKFNKEILKKGKFEQFLVSAYASVEYFNQKPLVFSNKVEEPTWFTHRNQRIALIIPFKNSIEKAVSDNYELIMKYTGIQAPYLGIFDFNSNLLFTK